jgi:S-formylglutathione hydrolase FrmB
MTNLTYVSPNEVEVVVYKIDVSRLLPLNHLGHFRGMKEIKVRWFFTWTVFAVLLLSVSANASTIDTVSIYSNSMHKESKAIVIYPNTPSEEPIPVLYLLHGLGGDYGSWLKIKPALVDYADERRLIIVCPDGGERSWYLDSPIDSSFRYETHLTQEVVPYIDSLYNTIQRREGRAIAGLSMGGHGSLFLAIRHPELFSIACSTSGSVDLLKRTFSWKYKEMILGDTTCCVSNWQDHSVTRLAEQLSPGLLKLHIDCGTEDELIEVNRDLHRKLLSRGVEHEYIEKPGAHDAAYWAESIDSIMSFVMLQFELK